MRITDERHLFRYADWIGESEFERLERGKFFRDSSVLNEFTMEEIFLLSKISRGVMEVTEIFCRKRIGVHFNHLSAIGLFRVVQAISDIEQRSLSVFEVGPGSGYTGLLVALQGHTYASYDVAQGLYLWQN